MIIIPDIHGRTFWKDAVRGREDDKIVFLGDYLDPYPDYDDTIDEIIKLQTDAIRNLNEIIEFKKSHSDNVILLVGNHDVSYMFNDLGLCKSRHDNVNHELIYHIFQDNFDLFKIAYEEYINGKRYIFSHAGLSKEWMIDSHEYFGHEINLDNIVEMANLLFKLKEETFVYNLGDFDSARGGYDWYGSVVWADVSEWAYEYVGNQKLTHYAYQIFGHSQCVSKPIITDNYACLDVRRGFELTNEGVICELDGKPAQSAFDGIDPLYER